MATLTSQEIIEAGLDYTYTSIDAANKFINTGREFILYLNESTESSKVIAVTAEVTTVDSEIYGDLTKSNPSKTVAASGSVLIGPFPVEAYNDSDGYCNFTITTTDGNDKAVILYLS